jgi:ubiquinone/menaquinone biosynthesis C-methylase UbiE
MSASGEMFSGSADVYDRFVGRYGAQLSRALIEAAGIPPEARVLDVGCGTGELTRALAERVGGASVSAVDPSEPFVEACRSKVPDADVRVARAEALPFEDDSFDAVLSQLVVNFIPDVSQGMAEMRRVTRPGGTVTGCVWDYKGEMTMLRTFWDAASALDPEGAGPVVEGRVMPFAQPEDLETLWREAGLDEVKVVPLLAEASYDDFDDLWAPFLTGVGPAGRYAASVGADAQAALRGEFFCRLGEPQGPFTLSARAWCAVGWVHQPQGALSGPRPPT